MRMLRPSLIRSAVLAIGAGLLVWIVGVPWLQSVLVASVALTAGVGNTFRPFAFEPVWPDRIEQRRHGTRREVARLASSLSARERDVSASIVARLRGLAEQRLARVGIDVHDPGDEAAARQALGTTVHARLFGDLDARARHVEFLRCLDAVERLAPSPTAPGAAHPPEIASVSAPSPAPPEDDARDHV